VPYSGLDTVGSFVLLGELDEAAALTRVGVRTLQRLHHVVEESAAVLTLLAIGSEKMLKATMGLASLDAGQPWPSRSAMRAWGHDVNALNVAALVRYEQHIGRSTAPGYVRQLLNDCSTDTTLTALLDMLSAWGLRRAFIASTSWPVARRLATHRTRCGRRWKHGYLGLSRSCSLSSASQAVMPRFAAV
jgi:hypothetical protein